MRSAFMPVEDVAEALPLLADQRVGGQLEVVEEDLGRGVVDHRRDRADLERGAALAHVDEEQREALGAALHLLGRRRAREQDHQVRVQRARGPDLLAVDDPALAAPARGRLDRGRVGPGAGLGHREGLQAQLAGGDRRQPALALRVGAVAQDRPHHVHLRVAGGGVAAARVDLLEDHARRVEREAGAAVALGDQRREPAVLGQRADELARVAVGLELAPVAGAEAVAQLAHGAADVEEVLREGEVHRERPA